MITFGSLFAGIGGIDLGLERAGMTCKWQVEIDDYCNKVLEKHWPNVPKFRDVRECSIHLARVDLIAGGFPCQDISSAGKRVGINGERSGLWFEFARIIRELRPRYVLVENVAALLYPIRRNRRIIEPAPIGHVLEDLATLGYDAEWHCIPAAAVGAPHLRDRAFIVAYSNGGGCPAGRTRRLAGLGSWIQKQTLSQSATLAYADEERRRASWPNDCQTGVNISPVRSGERRAQIPKSDFWIIEPGVGRVADGIPARMDRLGGLGNAVVPQVAELIGRYIIEAEQRS